MLLSYAAAGESEKSKASIALDSDDVPAFLWQLNQQLRLGISTELLADSAKALARGQEFSKDIQIHVQGVVGTATYGIAKSESGAVVISFVSGWWSVEAICEQMREFSEGNESAQSPSDCEATTLELIET